MTKRNHNIRLTSPDPIEWDSAKPANSLKALGMAVEAEADTVIDWYWKEKRWKSYPSRFVQSSALVLTAAAGLSPIIIQLLKNAGKATGFDSGPLASLLVGFAAALLGLDKAFGYSTGWTRYVLTATSMTKLLHEFRIDWVGLTAAAAAPPTTEQQAAMIQRAKEFVSAMRDMVAQETKDWATEFQSNTAQMEKDLKAQLDTLKAQVERAATDKEAATKPGAIELTVTNAEKTDRFSFDIRLEWMSGESRDSVSNAGVWTRINTAPGQYKITVTAQAKGSVISTSTVAEVKPGETAKPSVTLPLA